MSTPSPAPAAAASPSGFTVLHVVNNDDAVLHAVRANDPAHGRVAVQVRPGIRRVDWLTRGLLGALGVDFGVTGGGRNAGENLQLLPVRMVSERISDVLVDAAQSLTPGMLTDLMLLAAAAGARLWVVTTPPVTESLTTTLTDWCATEVTVAEAATHWPGLTGDGTGPKARGGTSTATQPSVDEPHEPRHLPLVDATTLLAACHRMLQAHETRWVQERLGAAVAGAGRLLDGATTADGDRIAAWLLDRYDRSGTLAQFLTDVRGLQIAALWRGLLVQVDVPALLGTASAAPSASARTPAVWQRLRAYRLPVRGAACALAAARLGATDICTVTLADTSGDGASVTVDGRTIEMEPDAAEYVGAQRLLRLASGAPPTAPLLATSTGTPLTDKGLARMLSEARAELGIVVTSRLVERAAPDGATTLRRWGLTTTAIGEPVPGTPAVTAATADAVTASDAPAPTGAAPLLDVDLLRRRRVEMRLSRRDVAKHLGVTSATVNRLESGVNHGEQPLGLLQRLADLLALDLADVLPRRRVTAGRPVADEVADEVATSGTAHDTRLLGAALHTLGVLVPAEALADVLGWDAARLTSALAVLEVAAPAVGLRVHRLYNRVSLARAADALPAEQLAAVLRHDAARTGLNPVQAGLVHDALTRAVAPAAGRGGRHMLARSNAEKVAAGSLVGAAILTTDDTGDLALHPDAAASLLVPTNGRQQ